MVIHLQNAPFAGGAMMGAIRLFGLTLLAVAQVSRRRFDCEGRVLHSPSFLCWKMAISVVEIHGRTGVGKDGGGIAPIEHYVQKYTEKGGKWASP